MDTPTVTTREERLAVRVPQDSFFELLRPRVPAPREFLVPRPRLVSQVEGGAQGPLTLVTGPAGTGKTALVEAWAAQRQQDGPVGWLTLGDEHNQAGLFWGSVLESLRPEGVASAARGDLLLPDVVDHSFLVDLAASVGDSARPVVLVLDQLDRVTDERVLLQLDQVLDAAQPALRLVVTSRRDPRALSRRRRLRGAMTTIQATDLAFTLDETVELLRRHGLDVPDAAVTTLQETTQGWAAGLRLCALAMREHGEQAGPTGGPWAQRRLAGYLVDEVLDSLPGDTRELMLRLCVVDVLEPSLARSLSGRRDADQVLAELAGEDLFVTTGTEPGRWYRIHPLLLEVLRKELRARGEDVVTYQHARAARWFDAHSDPVRAAVHYVAAGSWEESCASVVRHLGVVQLLEHRAPRDLEGVLAHVPQGAKTPEVRVVQAATELGAHRPDRAAESLAELDSMNLEAPSHSALRASLSLSRLVMASDLCDGSGAVDAWRELEPTLGTVGPPRVRAQARALALSALSSALLWGGDYQAFVQILGAVAEAAEAEGCEYARISVLGQQALAAYRRGALRDSARLGEEALRLGREHGLKVRHRTGVAHLAMSAVALEWNDRVGSRRHLEHADLAAQVENEPVLGAAVKLALAYHHALDGRRALAMSAVADVRATAGSRALPSWIAERVEVVDALVRLQCGDAEGAVAVLDAAPSATGDWLHARASAAYSSGDAAGALALLAPVVDRDRLPTEHGDVEAMLLVARIRLDHGDVPAARRALVDALRVARPEGRRRPFVAARDWLQPLLTQDAEVARASSWIGRGLTSRHRTAEDAVPVLVEPLTSREKSVLALMAQVMTVAEIAEDLHISVNTVKTHQRSLYRKLSVARAHDAVRRGRALELI
ncbi:LuxR C-terminal-related transcriptional regulator [Pedococcus sp. KACC 23699]|uniref:LuxR C-terminal-related transcriptional regulator n=1 Tax=Pedococcus sp. KACC 23699 TaxID=3149228 RepID=A0AAU7JSZ0_9MICO